MNNSLLVKLLKIELVFCRKNKQKAMKYLKNAREGSLRVSTNQKYNRFYLCTGDSQGKYLNKKDLQIKEDLATKEYFKIVYDEAAKREKAILAVLELLEGWSWDQIINRLHIAKKPLVKSDIVSATIFGRQWEKEKYEKLEDFDNQYPTKKGDMVKSKAEVYIADLLFDNGIPYKYEQKFTFIDGSYCYPDFTIYDKKRDRFIIFEHFGLVDDPNYALRMNEKISKYIKSGLVPYDTLIYTFESENLVFQMEAIEGYVKNVLAA